MFSAKNLDHLAFGVVALPVLDEPSGSISIVRFNDWA